MASVNITNGVFAETDEDAHQLANSIIATYVYADLCMVFVLKQNHLVLNVVCSQARKHVRATGKGRDLWYRLSRTQ